jgi:hypothetical protein
MGFRNTFVRLPDVPFVDSGVQSIEIPRGHLIRALALRLTGNVVLAGAGTAALTDESPYPLLRRIELITDGRDTLKSVTGRQLFRQNHFYNGIAPNFAGPALLAGTNPFNGFLVLPFEMPAAIKPIDSLLDSRRHESIQLRITWGTLTAAADGVTSVLDGAAAQTQAPGTTSLQVGMWATTEPSNVVFSQHRDYVIEREITAASTDFDVDIPVGQAIRSIMLRFETGVSGDPAVGSDAICNNLSVLVDNAFFPLLRVPYLLHREKVAQDFGIVGAAGVSTLPTGYTLIEFSEDGRLGAALNTADIASLKLRLDVAAPGAARRVQAVVKEVVPAEVAEAAALAG